jgi:H+/Cl- antiporter ClcA
MPFRFSPREYLALGRYLARWLLLAVPAGAVAGSAVALFLWSLDHATRARLQHPWLLYLLPVAGALVGLLYHRYGKPVAAGNDLVMDRIHEPGGGVPARMAPLVLLGTLATHLCGGSAGREGTAVQMGGSIASTLGRLLRLSEEDTRTLLMAGVAAGFGAVFGTPLAGAVFAMEVLVIGRIESAALVPVLLASMAGDWTASAWGIHHTPYRIASPAGLSSGGVVLHGGPLLLAKMALAAAAFGLASVLFAEMAHGLSRLFRRLVPSPVLRPVAGALVVIALVHLLGTRDYLGLGVMPGQPGGASIVTSFVPGGVGPWSWWWKILFTGVTLGSGFKGGEVTPLFFVGAALGNALAGPLGVPVDLLAGLGFVAVFAGATNTPLACTLMGIELFGAEYALHIAVACFLAYLFSGHSGIYLSQRIATPKAAGLGRPAEPTLRAAREARPGLGGIRFVRRVRPLSPPELSAAHGSSGRHDQSSG